jgi:hypothetical protein
MDANYPRFRFDARLVQILLSEEKILTFRAVNVVAYFAGIVAIFIGFIYGTYYWIGSSGSTIALFNSNMNFRVETLLVALVLPFLASWIFIRLATSRTNLKLKTSEGLNKFLAKRRGNVSINWNDVETASLDGSKLVLNLKNGGFRAGWLKQVYFSSEEEHPSPSESQLVLLQKFLSRKLGDGFQINK